MNRTEVLPRGDLALPTEGRRRSSRGVFSPRCPARTVGLHDIQNTQPHRGTVTTTCSFAAGHARVARRSLAGPPDPAGAGPPPFGGGVLADRDRDRDRLGRLRDQGAVDRVPVPGREGYQTNRRSPDVRERRRPRPARARRTLPRGANMQRPRSASRHSSRHGSARGAARAVASYASTATARSSPATGGRRSCSSSAPAAEQLRPNPKAVAARAALRGVAVAGAPVHLTGLTRSRPAGSKGRAGPAARGAARRPRGAGRAGVRVRVPAGARAAGDRGDLDHDQLPAVWGLTALTSVSSIVEFLIALVGLGVAIDYSLLIIVRWREERGTATGGRRRSSARCNRRPCGRVQRYDGRGRAAGAGRAAGPVPVQRRLRRPGDPAGLGRGRATLLPVILSQLGPRLDWPHIRPTRASRPGRAGRRGRPPPVVVDRPLAVLAALLVAATTIQIGPATGNPNTLASAATPRRADRAAARGYRGRGADPDRDPRAAAGRAAPPAVTGCPGSRRERPTRGSGLPETAVVDVLPVSDSRPRRPRLDPRSRAHGARVGGIVAQNDDFISAGTAASR